MNKPNSTLLAWTVTLTASLFFFYEFVQLNLFNVIAVDLMQTYHLDAVGLGKLSSMYFYANALLLFPAGTLLDRFPTKKLIVFSLSLCVLGTFIFGIATVYWLAALGRFLVGCGSAFCLISCVRLASRWFSPSKMAFVVGIIVTIAMIGGLVAQTPFALLSQAVGWRNAILVDVALGVLIVMAIAVIVKDRPPGQVDEALREKALLQQLGLWRSTQRVLMNPYNWLCGLYTTLMNLPVFLLGALWGIHYLVQVHHVSEVQASYATTLFFLGVIFGSPAFGWFSDRIGRRVVPMMIGAVLSLGVFLVLMFANDLSLSALMTLFFLIGFTTSSQVLSYPTIAELNPRALTASSVSLGSVLIISSGAVFQPFFGWLMKLTWDHTIVDNVPVYAAQDFFNAMLIMPVAFILGLIIAFLIRETYCRSQA